MINAGVNFSESPFSLVKLQLCLKYPLHVELDVLDVTAGLVFFPPFSFFCLFYKPVPRYLCRYTYMWEYIPTNVHAPKRVCIYTGKGRVMLDCGWTMLAMSSRFMKEKYFCHLLAFDWKQSDHRLRSSCRHDARRYNLQVQTCSDILVS